jgi:hypothetical protein
MDGEASSRRLWFEGKSDSRESLNQGFVLGEI